MNNNLNTSNMNGTQETTTKTKKKWPLLKKICIFSISGILSIALIVALVLIINVAGMIEGFENHIGRSSLEALNGNEHVPVEEVGDTYVFTPTSSNPSTAIIHYPGALVSPKSFASTALSFAENGYMVIVQKMPANLAMFGERKADSIRKKYPNIQKWILSGYSMGGNTACSYLTTTKFHYDTLMIYGSFPTSGNTGGSKSLWNNTIPTLVINDSLDIVFPYDNLESNKKYLPKDARYEVIVGGNHSQFYDLEPGYGIKGEVPADISNTEQQEIVIQISLDFLISNGL
jgi:dienelactone hydrolase